MASNPLTDPNWSAEVTQTIVETVDKIRDRTTKPIVVAARGLVFGLLGAIVGIAAFVFLLLAVSRGLISLVEWPLDHDTAVWVSHAVLGGLLVLAGSICMAKRQSKESV